MANGFAHVQNGALVDGAGAPLKLRGVDLGYWLLWENNYMGGANATTGMTTMLGKLAQLTSQAEADQFEANYKNTFITQADINAIATAGFNSVRLPFNAARFDTTYLDNVVAWCKAAGLYVVIDMHAATQSQNPYFTSDQTDGTARLWYVAGAKQNTIDLWKQVATRFAGENTVLGYDLINEPDGLSMSNAALVQFYNDAADAIRAVDTNHVVIVEGRSFSHDPSMFTAPIDPNLMLEMHQYTWDITGRNIQPQLTKAKTAAAALGNVPIWMGEFGLNTAPEVSYQLGVYNAEPKIAGWAYWTWKGGKQTNGHDTLQTYNVPASWVFVMNWLTGKSGATKPTAAQARQGMSDELAAILNTTTNTAVLQALQAG